MTVRMGIDQLKKLDNSNKKKCIHGLQLIRTLFNYVLNHYCILHEKTNFLYCIL